MSTANRHHTKPSRPALRYHGAKWRLADWVIEHFPPHECYVEPFGGAAGVLLQKDPAPFEVLNDLDRRVVTFFRVLRTHTEDLIRAIELTPHSRHECNDAARRLNAGLVEDELEAARLYYVASWQSRHWPCTKWAGGWRFQRAKNRGTSVNKEWSDTRHLFEVAERLKTVQIECDEAAKVLTRYDGPDTLHYVDPPYVQTTRYERWAGNSYQHEMDDAEHRELAGLLQSLCGMVVISGYPSGLYTDLYERKGWACRARGALAENGKSAIECLWLNPAAQERQPQKTLFS